MNMRKHEEITAKVRHLEKLLGFPLTVTNVPEYGGYALETLNR